MSILTKLPEWIDWTATAIDPALPWKLSIKGKEVGAPWLGDALYEIYDEFADNDASLQQLTDACEEALIARGSDVGARFVVLHLYYWLSRYARTAISVAHEDDADDDTEALERILPALAHLVSLLPVQACTRAWPRVRWEIMNSYAAGLWKRAAALYDLAEEENLVAATGARLMRGHFRYVLAVDAESREDPLDDSTWEPRVLGSKDAFHPPRHLKSDQLGDDVARFLLFGGAVTRSASDAAAEDYLDDLRDSRNDLEKAIAAAGGRVCPVYEAMLGRCCLELGDFGNAARYLQPLLKRTIHFGEALGDSRKLRPHLYLQIARCLRAAPQPVEAANTLKAALREYPKDRPLLMEQADLAEQETDYVQALWSLKAAADAHPEMEQDLGIRLGLALGDEFVRTKEATAALDLALKQQPEIADLIAELVGQYWPSFNLLGDKARDAWLTGLLHLTHTARREARLRSPILESAVVSFAKAVEGELRERVFKPAKAAFESLGQAKARAGSLDRSQPEHRFVLFVIGQQAKLNLGDMQRVLAATRESREGLSSELRAWLSARIPRWKDLVGLLDDIVPARNAGAHAEDEVGLNARQVHAQCRRALDIVIGQAP